jgi:hypothetical protein
MINKKSRPKATQRNGERYDHYAGYMHIRQAAKLYENYKKDKNVAVGFEKWCEFRNIRLFEEVLR